MREGKKGFTLVELMVAALLAGVALVIALPLILVGRNTGARTEKREAVSLAGEAIYEYVADEVKFAGRLYIGDLNEKRPEGENWKSITVSEKDPDNGENYARLLYGAARELTAGEPVDAGTPLYDMGYQEKTDLVLEAEAVGRNQMRLTVKLMDGEQALYEKTSVLSLLNLTLNATNQIEGYVGKSMSTAPQEDAEGKTENALILWYQSSRETVKPFEDGVIEGDINDPIEPGPDQAVVSLANPQYVKVGETVQVQYIARAEKGKKIIKYDWSLQDNQSSDGSYYVEEPMLWADTSKTLSIKGLNVSPDDKKVKLTLVVTFEDGTTASDSCDVIVYEGYKPGEGPVDHFVIVPDGLEDEYIKKEMASTPIWIKKGSTKKIYLVAVDASGALTEYSPENWRDYSNMESKNYLGFHNDTWQSPYLSLDGRTSLINGKKTDASTNRNYVEVKATNMDISYNPRNNTTLLNFGGYSGTAYLPLGKKQVTAKRYINIYDAESGWKYGIDSPNRNQTGKEDTPVKVAIENEWIDLELVLNVDARAGYSVSKEGKPEIDEENIQWTLNNKETFYGDAVRRFQIKQDAAENYPQLNTGKNIVEYIFYDTAGEKYTGGIIINVPSEVSYVKLDQPDNITLLNLHNVVKAGITTQDISFTLYDESDMALERGLIDEYTISWEVLSEDNAFSINLSGGNFATPSISAKKEGTGVLKLTLKEKVPSEGNQAKIFECECNVTVVPLELKPVLLYQNDGSEILRKTFNTGMTIVLTDSTQDRLKGFSAEISLPEEFKLAEKELEGTDWDKADWSTSGNTALFTAKSGSQGNDYQGSFSKNKSGEIIFKVTAHRDPDVSMTIPVTIGAGIVNNIKVWDSDGKNKGTLVIGAGAKEESYNSVTLHAEMHATGNNSFNKDVKWEIIKGKDLIDLNASSILPGIPVDSADVSKYPKIVLKKNLTDKDAGDDKIEIKVSSVAAPSQYDVYKISVLPQFRIISPSYDFELTHRYSGSVNIPGSRELMVNGEGDRRAYWKIDPVNAGLIFADFASNNQSNSVVVQTKEFTQDIGTYTVTATDHLTGQKDSRKVIVKYEEIKDAGDNERLDVRFSPSGTIYLDMGEKLNQLKIKSSFFKMNKNIYFTEENPDPDGRSLSYDKVTYDSWGLLTYNILVEGIHALKPGKTTINAKILSITAWDYLDIVVCGIRLKNAYDPKGQGLDLNDYKKIELGGPNSFQTWDIENFKWESSNEKIATVDQNGVVTLKSPGKTQISVKGTAIHTGTEYVETCDLIVKDRFAEEVHTVSNEWADGTKNYKVLLMDSIYNSADTRPLINGKAENNISVYYTIKTEPVNKGVISILNNRVIAGYPGSASITTEAVDKRADQILNVKVYDLKGFTINNKTGSDMLKLITGTEQDRKMELSATPEFDGPAGNIPGDFKKCSWKAADSNSESVVKVTDNGDGTCTVEAIGMGAAYITCTSDANPNISETYVVIVSF